MSKLKVFLVFDKQYAVMRAVLNQPMAIEILACIWREVDWGWA